MINKTKIVLLNNYHAYGIYLYYSQNMSYLRIPLIDEYVDVNHQLNMP